MIVLVEIQAFLDDGRWEMGNALKWQVIARIRYADEEGERENRSNS